MLVDAPLTSRFRAPNLALWGYIVGGLRTACYLPPLPRTATRDGTRGLIDSSLPDNHSDSFRSQSALYAGSVGLLMAEEPEASALTGKKSRAAC